MHEAEDHTSDAGRVQGGLRVQGRFHKVSEPDRPLVTVITVVRNGGGLIERTLRNVIEQSYDQVEYIVIDGASTDGTIDVIRRNQENIAYWISEPDKGLYDAMNKGISLASGSWINFMNSGDGFYEKDTLSRIALLLREDVDLVYGNCQMVYGPDASVIWKAGRPQDLWKGMIFRHQSLFARKDICKARLFDLQFKIGADFDFIYACYRNNYRFRSTDLIVSSIEMGGLSDEHLVFAIHEVRRIVLRYRRSLLIDWYYRCLIRGIACKDGPEKISSWRRSEPDPDHEISLIRLQMLLPLEGGHLNETQVIIE